MANIKKSKEDVARLKEIKSELKSLFEIAHECKTKIATLKTERNTIAAKYVSTEPTPCEPTV